MLRFFDEIWIKVLRGKKMVIIFNKFERAVNIFAGLICFKYNGMSFFVGTIRPLRNLFIISELFIIDSFPRLDNYAN